MVEKFSVDVLKRIVLNLERKVVYTWPFRFQLFGAFFEIICEIFGQIFFFLFF